MIVDKSVLSRLIYKSSKTDISGTLLQERLFEREAHGVNAIADIDFTNIDLKPLIAKTTENSDKLLELMDENGAKEYLYITVLSSQLYHLLINFVKIPTNSKITEENTILYICKISLLNDKNTIDNKYPLDFLCFVGLNLDTDVVIEEGVYQHLVKNYSDTLSIEVRSEHKTHYKRATMDKIEDPYEVMSITRQETYMKRCKEILMYKALNPDTSGDNLRLDNLQFYLIEQQLAFGLFLSLHPLLALSVIRFSRVRKLSDNTGNLFFTVYLPTKTLNGLDHISLLDAIHIMMDFGFLISHEDIENNVQFSQEKNMLVELKIYDESFKSRSEMSHILGENNMYSLLFRLLDSKISKNLIELDDLILNNKNNQFDEEILKILA